MAATYIYCKWMKYMLYLASLQPQLLLPDIYFGQRQTKSLQVFCSKFNCSSVLRLLAVTVCLWRPPLLLALAVIFISAKNLNYCNILYSFIQKIIFYLNRTKITCIKYFKQILYISLVC